MVISRRTFGGMLGTVGVAAVTQSLPVATAGASESAADDAMGVLVDIPNCIGCRKCEYACRRAAGLDVPAIETFEDKSVFARARRPSPQEYTVVNRHARPAGGDPVYVKVNCAHCVEPACVSACLVGALHKRATGEVTYDAWKCMGCRYCMVACPFQIPTYDYDDPFTPQVRKCSMCHGMTDRNGGVPACVKICPNDALIYGKRTRLLAVAREKIRQHPNVYVDRVYGEHEAGGTSWLYLSSVPFEQLGFLDVGLTAPGRMTEAIQHGIFKHWLPPLAWGGDSLPDQSDDETP